MKKKIEFPNSVPLKEGVYDTAKNELFLRWKDSGVVYKYENVNENQAEYLTRASSPGRYVNRQIRMTKLAGKVSRLPQADKEVENPNGQRQRARRK